MHDEQQLVPIQRPTDEILAGPLSEHLDRILTESVPGVRVFQQGPFSFLVEGGGKEIPYQYDYQRPEKKLKEPKSRAIVQFANDVERDSTVSITARGEKRTSHIKFGKPNSFSLQGLNPSNTIDYFKDVLHFMEGIKWGMGLALAKKPFQPELAQRTGTTVRSTDPEGDALFASKMMAYALQFQRPSLRPGIILEINDSYQPFQDPKALDADSPKVTISFVERGVLRPQINRGKFEFNLYTREMSASLPPHSDPLKITLGREENLRAAFWHFHGMIHGYGTSL